MSEPDSELFEQMKVVFADAGTTYAAFGSLMRGDHAAARAALHRLSIDHLDKVHTTARALATLADKVLRARSSEQASPSESAGDGATSSPTRE